MGVSHVTILELALAGAWLGAAGSAIAVWLARRAVLEVAAVRRAMRQHALRTRLLQDQLRDLEDGRIREVL